MVYLDLDELPELLVDGGLISQRKLSLRSFIRNDHLYGSEQSIADEARELVFKTTGTRPTGPIRLLTQLRYFGHYLSPLNLYYVYDDAGATVQFVIAEVNNTPWNERHCYVLWDGNRSTDGDDLRFQHPKQFHVSPFMGMDMSYRWSLDAPGEQAIVHLDNVENDSTLHQASMTLQRRELTSQTLRRMTFRYPWMTGKIGAAIYFQALKLWWKKCPLYSHPKHQLKNEHPKANAASSITPP